MLPGIGQNINSTPLTKSKIWSHEVHSSLTISQIRNSWYNAKQAAKVWALLFSRMVAQSCTTVAHSQTLRHVMHQLCVRCSPWLLHSRGSKPLEMIVKKSLSKAPKRLQGMLLWLQKYDYDIRYNPGKNMVITDTLSRAFLPADPKEPPMEYEEANMVSFLPKQEEWLELRNATSEDETLQMFKTTIITGWPDKHAKVPEQLTPFLTYLYRMDWSSNQTALSCLIACILRWW